MKTLICVTVAALVSFAPVRAQGEEKKEESKQPQEKAATAVWFADFDKAVEQAKKDKKDLFVDFTGSDWCGWCIKLHEEVFSHDEFTNAVSKGYVLVALDYPHGDEAKAKVPNPERNTELAGKYEIKGYPTVLLLTPEGDVFGQTGYQAGGPEKYVAHVTELGGNGKKALAEVSELTKAFAAADAKAKPAIVEKAADKLMALKQGMPGGSKLVEIVKNGPALDPEAKSGLKIKSMKALMKSGNADDPMVAEAKTLDAKNEKGLYEFTIVFQCSKVQDEDGVKDALKAITDLDALGPIKDKEVARDLYTNAAFWNSRVLKDEAAAKTWAKKAKAFAGDNEQLNKFLDSLLKEG